MKIIILLLWSLGVCQAQSCNCSDAIPNVGFPVAQMEALETSTRTLTIKIETEVKKIEVYQFKMNTYLANIKNLTQRVEFCYRDVVTHDHLDFQLLKMEIQQLESLVLELRFSMNVSNTKLEKLYMEVQNISILVNQLEKYDTNNILNYRREIASLLKRLEECKGSDSPFDVQFGTCKHGRITKISQPQIVQVNWKGTTSKTGGWGKDSCLGSTQQLHWVLSADSSYFYSVRFYNSYNDLKQYKNYTDRALSMYGTGSGLTLYNNALFYNCYGSDLCKLSLDTNQVVRKTLPEAAFDNRFSYASSPNQYIDLEGDEKGMWAIYTKEGAQGYMTIGLLNETSLDLIRTWSTSVYKPSATNAFMVCGILYVTRAIDTRKEEIFYMYDTNTGEEHHLSIKFDKILENIHCLSYNANDRKLYVYNDGFETRYDMLFEPQA